MICTNCGSREATWHFKSNTNGIVEELHLCQNCAKKLGYEDYFTIPGFGINTLITDMIGNGKNYTKKSCPKCGSTMDDIANTGFVGCSECYRIFKPQLTPIIRRIHGTATHIGKIPGGKLTKISSNREIEGLKNELKAAIDIQDFEKAAILRDKIKELDGRDVQ